MELQVRRYFRRFLAVGQKVAEDESFGRGFNYYVEVSLPARLDRNVCLKAIREVVAAIDHKALGVDVRLNSPPTSENLAKFIQIEIQQRLAEKVTVLLERGDGLIVRVNS